MTTFSILTSGLYEAGQEIDVLLNDCWPGKATILRVEDHELLVRVGGRALAFQKHDGESWSWTEWTQGEMDVGDGDEQRRLV